MLFDLTSYTFNQRCLLYSCTSYDIIAECLRYHKRNGANRYSRNLLTFLVNDESGFRFHTWTIHVESIYTTIFSLIPTTLLKGSKYLKFPFRGAIKTTSKTKVVHTEKVITKKVLWTRFQNQTFSKSSKRQVLE